MKGDGGGRPRPLVIAAGALGIVAVIAAAAFAVRELTNDDDARAKQSGPGAADDQEARLGPALPRRRHPAVPAIRDLGVGIYGIQARWEKIAPTERPTNPTDPKDPAYEWPQYLTDSIKQAQKTGMKVQLLLMGAPSGPTAAGAGSGSPTTPRTSATSQRRSPAGTRASTCG